MNTCTTLCQTLEILPAAQGGTYIVIVWLPAWHRLTIGRLGAHDLPRGYYSYVGSAQRGLASRLHRHLHGATTRHWHLDYLRPHVQVMAWCAYPDYSQPECQLAQRLLAWGQVVIPRFGASDCSCPAHLLYYPHRSDAASGLRHAAFSMDDAAADPNAWWGLNKIK